MAASITYSACITGGGFRGVAPLGTLPLSPPPSYMLAPFFVGRPATRASVTPKCFLGRGFVWGKQQMCSRPHNARPLSRARVALGRGTEAAPATANRCAWAPGRHAGRRGSLARAARLQWTTQRLGAGLQRTTRPGAAGSARAPPPQGTPSAGKPCNREPARAPRRPGHWDRRNSRIVGVLPAWLFLFTVTRRRSGRPTGIRPTYGTPPTVADPGLRQGPLSINV